MDVAFSISGGLVVWWGLVIENRAEKRMPGENPDDDIFADIIAKQKRELKRGWRILMTGIVMEVVAALAVSVISGLENAALNEEAGTARKVSGEAIKQAGQANERAAITESNNLILQGNIVALSKQLLEANNNIAKNDPRNHRLERLSAFASLRLKPAQQGINWAARLSGSYFLTLATITPPNFLQLASDKAPEVGFMGDLVMVGISFHWNEGARAVQDQVGKWFPYLSFENATSGQIIDSAAFSEMGPFNFGDGTEILNGTVKVNFNGVEKTFSLPHAKCDASDPSNDPGAYRFKKMPST